MLLHNAFEIEIKQKTLLQNAHTVLHKCPRWSRGHFCSILRAFCKSISFAFACREHCAKACLGHFRSKVFQIMEVQSVYVSRASQFLYTDTHVRPLCFWFVFVCPQFQYITVTAPVGYSRYRYAYIHL